MRVEGKFEVLDGREDMDVEEVGGLLSSETMEPS